MFYLLYVYLHKVFSPFNIFQYITFRSVGAIITALLVSYLISIPIIKKLKKYKINQQIRDDGPKTHFDKRGTPTMGGIIIIFSILFSSILWARLDNRFIIICLVSVVVLGAIGFCDDYLKLVKKNPKGLSGKKKLLFQSLLAFAIAIYLYFYPSNSSFTTMVDVPFMKNCFVNFGILYILFGAVVIVGASNAVNLTDGLDGLAIGLIMLSALSYMVFAYLAGHVKFSSYLGIISVSGSGELVVFLSALVGAGLGFLWYNSYPAEVFMGDTGSLCLGGIIGIISVLVKQELLLVVVGGIFVIEALSVILQVFSFKFRGKRIFKMAPIHHHFELCGWPETKVVIRFWILGVILLLVALSALKVR
jgi:phospho-N-acetylmuramoyl-pentapeptide-transferase